jgi:hypothetical protein
MRDWQSERLRCLIHVSDGGSGMRYREMQLDAGDELKRGGTGVVHRRARGAAADDGAGACAGAARADSQGPPCLGVRERGGLPGGLRDHLGR